MPFCSTEVSAIAFISSSLMSFPASSSVSVFSASGTVIFFNLRRAPPSCWNMPWSWLERSSMPGGARMSICGESSETSTSTSRSSSLPSRSILRNLCRVDESVGFMSWRLTSRAGGSSTSSSRSSAASAARSRTLRASASRVCFSAASTRSRMIVSTSRPTYPTSVNLVASTLMNGASARRASRRAISVLPTPVGPIIRMFFGVISCRNGSGTCWRLQRLRSAIATARFAASWPTMCLSSSLTISEGVMCDLGGLRGERWPPASDLARILPRGMRRSP